MSDNSTNNVCNSAVCREVDAFPALNETGTEAAVTEELRPSALCGIVIIPPPLTERTRGSSRHSSPVFTIYTSVDSTGACTSSRCSSVAASSLRRELPSLVAPGNWAISESKCTCRQPSETRVLAPPCYVCASQAIPDYANKSQEHPNRRTRANTFRNSSCVGVPAEPPPYSEIEMPSYHSDIQQDEREHIQRDLSPFRSSSAADYLPELGVYRNSHHFLNSPFSLETTIETHPLPGDSSHNEPEEETPVRLNNDREHASTGFFWRNKWKKILVALPISIVLSLVAVGQEGSTLLFISLVFALTAVIAFPLFGIIQGTCILILSVCCVRVLDVSHAVQDSSAVRGGPSSDITRSAQNE